MSDTGSINKIISEPNAKKYVKYTPLFKARRGSDDSKFALGDTGVPWTTRVRQVVCALVLVSLFCIGVMGTLVMWTTDMFDAAIDDKLVLRNNSPAFEAWRKSPVKPLMKFTLFNYTNLKEFRNGNDDRLRVQEIGPYVFTEETERVNIKLHENGSITYQNKRTYEFVPELTVGSLDDDVVSLNVPLLTLNYQMRKSTYFQRLPLAGMLRLTATEPLHKRTVREMFWGYTDPLVKLASLRIKDIKVGILQQKNGTEPHRITIHSGEGNLNMLGQITHFEGRDHVDYYATEECNRVDGSDGSKFPPPQVRPSGRLIIYHRDVCRRVPLYATEQVTVFDEVPAIRFRPPPDVLNDGDESPENACYCLADEFDMCPPSGAMCTAHCKNNAPVYASFPHFYLGSSILREAVDGLQPVAAKHDLYLDIHERMGVPIRGRTRFQFNLLVMNTFNNDILTRLDRKLLPYIWLERDLGDFPEEVKKVLYAVSITAPKVKLALEWGSLALAVVTGLAMLAWIMVALYQLLREPLEPPEMYVMTRL